MKSTEGVTSERSLFEQYSQQHFQKETTELQVLSFITKHNLPFTVTKPVFELVGHSAVFEWAMEFRQKDDTI